MKTAAITCVNAASGYRSSVDLHARERFDCGKHQGPTAKTAVLVLISRKKKEEVKTQTH